MSRPLARAGLAAAAATLAGCSATAASPPRVTGSSSPLSPRTSTASRPAGAVATHLVARVAARLPAPVSRCVAVADGTTVHLLGGLSTGDVTTGRVVAFDTRQRRSRVEGTLTQPVHDASGVLLHGRPVVFGGGAATEQSLVQVWSGRSSRRIGGLPTARSDTAAVLLGSRAYVVGGYDGSRLPGQILRTSDGRSFAVAGRLAHPVRYPAVAAAGGRVWVAGGDLSTATGSTGGPQTAAVQRFDPGTGETTVVGRLPFRLGHANAFVLGGRLFVAGGRHGSRALRTIWQLDLASGAVTRAGRLPAAVSDSCVAVVGGSAWLFGGEGAQGPTAPLSQVVQVRLAS